MDKLNKKDRMRIMRNTRRTWLTLEELYKKEECCLENTYPRMVDEQKFIRIILEKYPKNFKSYDEIKDTIEYMAYDLKVIERGAGLIPRKNGRNFYKFMPFYNRLIDDWGFWKIITILLTLLSGYLGKTAITSYYEYKYKVTQIQTINVNQQKPVPKAPR